MIVSRAHSYGIAVRRSGAPQLPPMRVGVMAKGRGRAARRTWTTTRVSIGSPTAQCGRREARGRRTDRSSRAELRMSASDAEPRGFYSHGGIWAESILSRTTAAVLKGVYRSDRIEPLKGWRFRCLAVPLFASLCVYYNLIGHVCKTSNH